MPTKLALVTMRINPSAHYGKEFVAEPGIEVFLESLGFKSVFLAPQQLPDEALFARLNPELVLLSGGNDLSVVSGDPESASRDNFEKSLLELADRFETPTVGICRGFQLMNVAAGGSVTELEQHVNTVHELSIALQGSGPETLYVNSFHNFGIQASDLAGDFDILATAQDGTIEAAAHRSKPFMGFMWHPERDAGQNNLAREMVLRTLFSGT